MPAQKIPDIVISRLPIYLHALQRLLAEGITTTSSLDLSQKVAISAAQIRKDLSSFGEFGKQGTGYDIAFLIKQLQGILHIDRTWDIALVGAGDLGSAIARYAGFANRGFRVVMVFDNNPRKIRQRVGEFEVHDVAELEDRLREANIRVAMLAVPASAAQETAEIMVRAGVRAILNYAPVTLNLPQDVYVEMIDPIVQLQHMTYYLE
jgi:redox-sensing transcriptional repressor